MNIRPLRLPDVRSWAVPKPRPETPIGQVWAVGAVISVLLAPLSPADTGQFWNPMGTGGDGIWSTGIGDKNWNTTPGAPSGNTPWPDTIDDVAVFQDGVGGTVIVFEPVQAHGIVQNGNDYSIIASSLTLVPNSTGQTPFVEVGNGLLTINSVLAGDGGLVKSGSGSLRLTNSNPLEGPVRIEGGRLLLHGTLASTDLDIAPGTELRNVTGGLGPDARVTNAGTFDLESPETISIYESNGGTLYSVRSRYALETDLAFLNDGSTVRTGLTSGHITTRGTVELDAAMTADRIEILDGVLTNRGTLGDPTTHLDIAGGARLVARGVERYAMLTTSGAGAGTWDGHLDNVATVAPGDLGMLGTLTVTRDFANLPTGTLAFDVSAADHDRLRVWGGADLGGTLEVRQLGPAAPAPFVPLKLVDASTYSGNISTLVEDLPGAVFFNPGSGNLVPLGPSSGSASVLAGLTGNQASSWIALYDDVIEPGVTNVFFANGFPLAITSGVADFSQPDLTWALEASLTPDGPDRRLLNRLSPAPYAGFASYAITATRNHQHNALNVPALPSRPEAPASDSKSGVKDATVRSPNILADLPIEFFVTSDLFQVDTGFSPNEADYELTSRGLLAGARMGVGETLRAAAYFAIDDGDVKGSLIRADASGWSIGAVTELLVNETTDTRLLAGMSYGTYTFDGSRTGVVATSAGWSPGQVGFADVEADSFDVFVGLESVLHRSNRIRVIPAAFIRSASGSMDAFRETSSPGSSITLDVGDDHYQSALAEFSVRVEADLTDRLLLSGLVGVRTRLGSDDRILEARLAGGSRPIRGTGEELSSHSSFLGVGAAYRISNSVLVHLSYRSEFRSGANAEQGLSIGSTFRF